jgi:hypothetical protein
MCLTRRAKASYVGVDMYVDIQVDGNALAINLLQVGVPFAAFFLGIVIRKFALPGKNSPSLACQFLLGVPVSLVIVSPLLNIFSQHQMAPYLATVGLVIEHGMLVMETVTKWFKDLPDQPNTSGAVTATVPSR